MRVFAVILNWNCASATIKCVESLGVADQTPEEIVVVDNGSADKSVNKLKDKLSGVATIICNNENYGYALGLRVGINYALMNGADAVWLLNCDTVTESHTLAALMTAWAENGDALYSPRIHYSARPDVAYYYGFFFNSNSGRFQSPAQEEAKLTDKLYEVDSIQGASLLIPKGIIQKYGFMREDYFLYFEEIEYSLRLRKEGVKCYCVGPAFMYHAKEGAGGKNSRRLRGIRIYYRTRNQMLLWREHFTKREVRRYFVKFGYELFRPSRLKLIKLDDFGWTCLGYIHGLLGRHGKSFF